MCMKIVWGLVIGISILHYAVMGYAGDYPSREAEHLMSWAFYDDKTGLETARALIEKAKEGVDVKVIVDGQVSVKGHHDAPIRLLEDNGVSVVRWRDADRPYDGNHRKMMIVDGQEAIIGGLNIGDVYSHKAGETKWRDTDVLLAGPAAYSLETAASSTVPLRTMSSNCIFCSKTMRAPVRLRDISVQASTV